MKKLAKLAVFGIIYVLFVCAFNFVYGEASKQNVEKSNNPSAQIADPIPPPPWL